MSRRSSRHPTELELEILKILWRDGPSSVRHVREQLVGFRDLAYTSVMTVLGIMTRKKYTARKKRGNSFVYRAVLSESDAGENMLQDVVRRVFDGSVKAVVQNLLATSDIDDDELREIRKLVLDKERKGRSRNSRTR